MARVRAMEPAVIASGGTADAHNYIVLGGAVRDWARALTKRWLKLNLFPRGFELFWIRLPGAHGDLRELAAFADAPPYDAPAAAPAAKPLRPLRPSIAKRLPFSEASAREAFEMARGRRTAGKVVLEMEVSAPASAL